MARDEGAHAVLQRLLGAARDEQHAQLRERLRAQHLREGHERGHAREVVVCARDRRAAPYVCSRRGAKGPDQHARAREPAPARRGRRERQQRRAETYPPLRRRRLDPFDQRRGALVQPP